MDYQPDLQGAVDQRLVDRDTEPRCTSCGMPFVEHLGIVGTCAELQAARAQVEALTSCDMSHKLEEWRQSYAAEARLREQFQTGYEDAVHKLAAAREQVEALTKERGSAIEVRADLAAKMLASIVERDAAIARTLDAQQAGADAIGKLMLERDALKAALRAAGNRVVYSLQLEHHKSECGCVDCRMVINIDALLGEKETP
jgi:hypothetical protein